MGAACHARNRDATIYAVDSAFSHEDKNAGYESLWLGLARGSNNAARCCMRYLQRIVIISIIDRDTTAMPKEAVFTLKLEPELRDQFMAEAAASDRPASQLVREFMRDFVRRQREARDHDTWFRAEVSQGLSEAEDPEIKRIPHEEVVGKWRQQRAALVKRASRRARAG